MRLLRCFAPRNDNEPDCHCEAFRKKAVAISLRVKVNQVLKIEIDTPERFSVQARNDNEEDRELE